MLGSLLYWLNDVILTGFESVSDCSNRHCYYGNGFRSVFHNTALEGESSC